MAIKSSDQISLVDLTDGFSVILTNDSYTFPGSTNAAKAGSTTTTIVAMCGADQIPAAVDNSKIIAPTGVTTSVDTDATQPTVTISVTTAVKTGGTVDIPVSLDGGNIIIHKYFTFQIAFTGATGAAKQQRQGQKQREKSFHQPQAFAIRAWKPPILMVTEETRSASVGLVVSSTAMEATSAGVLSVM